jgi:ankyrin repeat protein
MAGKPHRGDESAPHETIKQDTARHLHLTSFLQAVWNGNMAAVRAWMEEIPDSKNYVADHSGMNGLHLAVGRNNLEMTKALVEAGAEFVPDAEGRMPSVIAAEMEVSEELADYIVEAESRALEAKGQEDV